MLCRLTASKKFIKKKIILLHYSEYRKKLELGVPELVL